MSSLQPLGLLPHMILDHHQRLQLMANPVSQHQLFLKKLTTHTSALLPIHMVQWMEALKGEHPAHNLFLLTATQPLHSTHNLSPHEAYHPTHRYPISSPSVSVQLSVGHITGTTITNVGNNNSYGRPQASLHPSVLVNSEGHITNTDAQSIPHHNACHLATLGGPISNPSVSVQSGVGKITDATITYVGDNNIYEDSQGTASNSHPLMSTLDTQSVPYHQPVNGHPISSSSVSVSSGGDITNTAIPNIGNNNYGNPQKNNCSNVQA